MVFDDANHMFDSIEPENRNKGFLNDFLIQAPPRPGFSALGIRRLECF
jgi:hypothetical protein